MYAVIEDRNQQFRVAQGDRLLLPLNANLEAGASVTFDKVCVLGGGDGDARIGAPYVEGATVTGTVVGTAKGPKVVVAKFRRRKNSRRRTGFRARFTEVQIQEIAG